MNPRNAAERIECAKKFAHLNAGLDHLIAVKSQAIEDKAQLIRQRQALLTQKKAALDQANDRDEERINERDAVYNLETESTADESSALRHEMP